MNKKPLFTIITASLNQVEYITESVESVMAQDDGNIEHLIIDGGSTDGTLDTLRTYPHLRVFSKPDSSVYDAWNKGLKLAKGQVIGFLNADDRYEPNTFTHLSNIFQTLPEISALSCRASVFRQESGSRPETIHVSSIYPKEKILEVLPFTRLYINAWFFRKSIFDQIGDFSTQYKLSSDREFLLRLAVRRIQYLTNEFIVYHYREHSDSLTFGKKDQHKLQSLKENLLIAESYLKTRETPNDVRRTCRAWHSRRSLDLMAFYRRNRKFGHTAYYGLRGLRYNPKLLRQFIKPLPRKTETNG